MVLDAGLWRSIPVAFLTRVEAEELREEAKCHFPDADVHIDDRNLVRKVVLCSGDETRELFSWADFHLLLAET